MMYAFSASKMGITLLRRTAFKTKLAILILPAGGVRWLCTRLWTTCPKAIESFLPTVTIFSKKSSKPFGAQYSHNFVHIALHSPIKLWWAQKIPAGLGGFFIFYCNSKGPLIPYLPTQFEKTFEMEHLDMCPEVAAVHCQQEGTELFLGDVSQGIGAIYVTERYLRPKVVV